MKRTDDIANLLDRIGVDKDRYYEIDNAFEYKEAPIAGMSSDTIAPGEATLSAESHDAPSMVVPPENAAASPLRNLLAEVALERQVEARARNEEALRQSLGGGGLLPTPARVIAVVSPKGGVGRTTLAAALAGNLAGGRALAIDLDPQNGLHHHLGSSPDISGLAGAGLSGENWNTLLLEGIGGTRLLPFGSVNGQERHELEQYLRQDRHWLARQLSRMALGVDDVVVLDTPAGQTLYLEQAMNVASQVLLVLNPDAASFRALDAFQQTLERSAEAAQLSVVINRFDASRTFCRDMAEVLRRRFGEALVGCVPLDHVVDEGLAFGVNPLLEDEACAARREVHAIGRTLSSRMPLPGKASGRAR